MKKSVSLALFSTVTLAIFLGINAFIPRASWEENEKYRCEYDWYQWYNCYEDEDWEFSCSWDEEKWWACSKDWWWSSMSCYTQEGEWEEEWLIGDIYIYCTPEYSCVLEWWEVLDEWESIEDWEILDEWRYHCTVEESGWFGCYDWDGGGSYCWSEGLSLNNCEREWDDYYCYKKYNITNETDFLYHFELSWEWYYNCGEEDLAASVGGLRGPAKGPSYVHGYAVCKNPRWAEDYQYCKEDWEWWYICPKLYSYYLDIDKGVYNFYEDVYWDWDYYCESDSEWEGEWWEDEWEERGILMTKGGWDTVGSYFCYYMEDESFYYDSCTKKTSPVVAKWYWLGWYSCPITYSCDPEEGGNFCEEDNDWDYYCIANNNGEDDGEDLRWGGTQTYSCFSGLNNLLSDECYADMAEEKSASFLWFFCPSNVEKYTITISANDSWYWSVNPSWEIDNIPSWTEILIDENNVLTIWGIEVVATPTASTPEYTYSLSGWTNNCGNTLSGNCIITANFSRTANKYTITFVDGDRTYVYTWAYWSNVSVTAPSWTKEWYSLSWEGSIPSTMPAEHITITAQWTINQYTITFNYNGGTGTPASITQDYNTTVSEPTEPIREWYTFAGWYDGNNPVSFPYTIPASNKTLTAHWSWNNSWWNGNNSWWGGYSWRWWHSWGWNSDNNHGSADDKLKVDDKPTNSQSSGDDKNITPSSDTPDTQKGWNEYKGWDKPYEKKYTQEVYDVYEWAYKNWLTKYADISEARLDEYLNRSEMAKISTIFATQFRWETPDEEKKEFCSRFSDLWKVEEDTKEYIIQSCELWNMWYQANGVDELQRFRPYTPVSLAEASIILSRMMRWNKYAVSENKWYQWHLWAAYEHRLIDNISKPFNNITRKEAFMMLYKMSSSDVLRD